jgi:sulfoxide reductase heme-binding subunit YedZ
MRQIRWVLKPIVFLACLIPAARLGLGALNATGVTHLLGISLGADPVKVMLHTCGRWTLNFVMITLCMTPLKDLTHLGVWLRFRRMFGLFAFFYVLLHFSVYLLLDQSGKLGALWQDIVKRPYITIGMLGLLLLIPLAATSTAKAQRRLRKRWTQLHRLIYVIASARLSALEEPSFSRARQRRTDCKDRWSLSSSASVVCQSMHGSVMDRPYSSLLKSFGMDWLPAFK